MIGPGQDCTATVAAGFAREIKERRLEAVIIDTDAPEGCSYTYEEEFHAETGEPVWLVLAIGDGPNGYVGSVLPKSWAVEWHASQHVHRPLIDALEELGLHMEDNQ